MGSICAENESEEIALMGILREAGVGKVGYLIGLQIEDADGLAGAGCLGTVAIIEERRIVTVRAQGDGHREAVHGADAAGAGIVRRLLVGRLICCGASWPRRRVKPASRLATT